MTRDKRRLTAIVSADVVGYSRLMGRDESGTLAALKAHLRELIDPKIAEYGGRTVKSMGDGLLLEFPSVVDAVRCAVDVQRGMAERNADVPDERQIRFRIGINVGDIIIDGNDIFGDGVNVAARLQTLAEPGGICVSRSVRDQVLDKLSFAFEDLGAQEVKNIARPVEVFRIRDAAADAVPGRNSPAAVPASSQSRPALGRRWRNVAAATAVLGAACVAVWVLWLQPKLSPDPTQRPTSTASATGSGARPFRSLAILPFTVESKSGEDEQLARDLTREMTASAGRALREGLVVSNGLVQQYSQRPTDPRTVGTELNVRYVVEGNLRHKGEAQELTVEVIDALDGTHLWSGRQAVIAGDPAQTVVKLVNPLRGAIADATRKEVASLPKAQRDAWDLVFRGWAMESSIANASREQQLYENALRLDPTFVPALLGLQNILFFRAQNEPEDRAELVRRFDEVSKLAITVAPTDPRTWYWRGFALQWQDNWNGALSANDEALRLDPYRSGTLLSRAWLLIYSGRPGEALDVIARANELEGNPHFGDAVQCVAYMGLKRAADAAGPCEQSAASWNYWVLYAQATAAYANLGDAEKTAAWKRQLLEANPKASIARLRDLGASHHPDFLANSEYTMAGLRRAGLPEQ
jgi:adenylate cyclase